MVKIAFRWVCGAAVAIAAAWVFREPKLESWLALASALAVLAGAFMPFSTGAASQEQSVTDGSTGIQAGGNVTIGGSVGQDKI